MEIVPSSMTVAKFCEELDSHAIQVNWRYQRSEEVWPAAAQSFLIESILLGFPIPKLFLHQQTDRVSRKTVHYIVDGQQRSVAIKAFYDGELRLSRSLEFADAKGKTYGELSDELQDRFLSYGLGIDLFVNATEELVREVFRRINSYEVPLNPEEQRHARWQGDFKWYIYHLSRELDQPFERFGTFSDKELVRMQDMKLLAEISHALLNGITTTNKGSLDRLYRDYDEEFKPARDFRKRIEDAMAFVDSLETIHGTGLMKAYALYSLVLAVTHVQREVLTLKPVGKGGTGLASASVCQRRLSVLAAAIDDEEYPRSLNRFIQATEKGTNVKAKRVTRAKYFADAVSRQGGELLPRR